MKRLLCFLLALAATLSLVGCSFTETDMYSEIALSAEEILGSYETEAADIADETLPPTNDAKQPQTAQTDEPAASETETAVIDENGSYTSRDDVALYIHTYGKLPQNFITKKEAQALGWSGGSLEPYAPGKCIGGTHFGNYEGLLPEKEGRSYTECDIDTLGKDSRGAKRIVFSNDGLIYYTEDHYSSFTLLYGEE